MLKFKQDQQRTTRQNMRGGKGEVYLDDVAAVLPESARLFSRITLKPGCSIGYHVHENETELFYFAEGSGIVNDDGNLIRVNACDAMATPSGHGHGVENDGTVDMVIIAVIVKDPAR